MDLPFLGYPLAAVMGLVMGLLGAGGGILTVPLLVYTLGVPPVQATAYSLLIVGIGAAVAAWQYHSNKKRLVDLRIGLMFAIPSLIGVFAARTLIVPFIPETIIDLGPITFTRDNILMLTFAALMLSSAWVMIKPFTPPKQGFMSKLKLKADPMSTNLIIIEGLGVGIITGMVGAGGGFIIVPVLVLLAKLPMKKAVATSLFIIAIKSFLGFSGDLVAGTQMDWLLLFGFTIATLMGILASNSLHKKVPEDVLKKSFGYFVIIMGGVILAQQMASIFYFGNTAFEVAAGDILPPPEL